MSLENGLRHARNGSKGRHNDHEEPKPSSKVDTEFSELLFSASGIDQGRVMRWGEVRDRGLLVPVRGYPLALSERNLPYFPTQADEHIDVVVVDGD
jgi:hypothetical protein